MEELRFPLLKKFAIGYFFARPGHFVQLITPYIPALAEVYFPLPGILSAREITDNNSDEPAMRAQLISDLQTVRRNGIMLDLLINATCYGEKAYSSEWRHTIEDAIQYLDDHGVKPEIVTTMSPYVAQIIKMKYPEIDIRASVNQKLGSTLAMEYVSGLYDSFYMSRDLQRDIPTMQKFSQWCKDRGKKLCMLVNSGCVRNCPYQVFHETLLAHGFWRIGNEAMRLQSNVTLCFKLYSDPKNYEEILRSTWIRPEDLHYYAPYADVFKLSTRERDLNKEIILRAYTTGQHNGDLLDLLDPNFRLKFKEYMFDNTAFPNNWVESKTAGKCAIDCTHCGKCTNVLKNVLKINPNYTPPPEEMFRFNANHICVGNYSFN